MDADGDGWFAVSVRIGHEVPHDLSRAERVSEDGPCVVVDDDVDRGVRPWPDDGRDELVGREGLWLDDDGVGVQPPGQ